MFCAFYLFFWPWNYYYYFFFWLTIQWVLSTDILNTYWISVKYIYEQIKGKIHQTLLHLFVRNISPPPEKKVKIKKEYIKCTIGDLVSLHSFRFSPQKSITTLVRVNLYTYQHIKHWQFANMLYASKEFILWISGGLLFVIVRRILTNRHRQ